MFFSLLIFVFISMTNASCAVITFDNASPNWIVTKWCGPDIISYLIYGISWIIIWAIIFLVIPKIIKKFLHNTKKV
jgi:Na+/proline symporter